MTNEKMTVEKVAKGRCLCGAVGVVALHRSNSVCACHCGMCRKWSGSPWLAVDCGTEVVLDGEENIKVYDSSPWAERGFCTQCGTHLFYRLKHNGLYYLPMGLLDEGDPVKFDTELYIDEKPAYYSFANETEQLTTKQVYARYAPSALTDE